MISCTEFIPCYSQLFTYLEDHYGPEEVRRYWKYAFTPNGKNQKLINFVEREGIKGCYSYWAESLNEEAADFTMYLNEKRGFFMMDMHKCPSKGRLLKLKEEIGMEPYRDYCLHCDSYRASAEKAGLKYIYNFRGQEKAACSMLIYDPKVFDGRVIIDADTRIMDRKASDNEYFHREFHRSMNTAINYLGEHYGPEVVQDFLTQYTVHVYAPVFRDAAVRGLAALEAKILDTYEKEKAPDAVCTVMDGNALTVTVRYCPGVKFLLDTGRTVSPWYRYTTETVMRALAANSGCRFSMDYYREETGAAAYRFEK